MAELQGKTALVTGATRGIGRAIAEALAARGCNVVVAARHEQDCRKVAESITNQGGGKAIGVAADVMRSTDCQRLVSAAVDAFGGLHILINNAGIGGFSPVEKMDVAHWDRVIGTNLNSLFYCTHAALPQLKKEGGWVINIGSLAGKNAFPGGAAYNASKFGLIGFSEALMQEVRHDDVRVSYIMPGSVATDFEGSSNWAADWMIQPQDIGKIVIDLLDMPARTLPSRVEVRPSKPPKK
ncbi:MAG TPA: SDR family oxidoreductase [Longimicrobiales bacterium]|nr:SDR family oxidoreductase [Longimicrobiales bacterium]